MPVTIRQTLVGATAAAGVLAGTAAPPAPAADVPAKLERAYRQHYQRVKRLGGAPGRNILEHGVRRHGRERAAAAFDVRRSLRVLKRMEASLTAPPPIAAATTTRPTTATGASTATTSSGGAGASTASASGGGGGGSLPSCTWAPESGGDYGAVNSSSGARGKYQIMPSTYAAYGGDGSWSAADQDRIAARVYAASGGSAWVNC